MTTVATCPFDHHAIRDVTEAPAVFAGLREQGVVFSPEHGGFYVLSRYDDVLAALRDPDTFASGYGTRIPDIGDGRIIPLDFDPPVHTDYRALFTEWVTPETVRNMAGEIRPIIDKLIDDFYAQGGGDWVSSVGAALPLEVLVRVIGFSPETVAKFRAATEKSLDLIGDEDVLDAHGDVLELVRAELRRHLENPGEEGYIPWLMSRQIEGRPIREDEAERVLLTFAVAGHETTMNASSMMLRYLTEDPARQRRLRENPDLIPTYVEEAVRLTSPIQVIARCTTRETEVGGVTIPAGSRVLLAFASANRDAARYPDPDAFDVDRGARGHLAFSFGRHACGGALLARTELRLVLEKLITLPEVVPTGEPTFGSFGGGRGTGPVTLPIGFRQDSADGEEA